jgi:hypothetical protein
MMAMIADETPPFPDDEPPKRRLEAANNNDGDRIVAIDPRVLDIARAVGRQLAREELDSMNAANDNHREGTP